MEKELEDRIIAILAARCYCYQFLQRVFGNEPNEAMVEALTDGQAEEVLGFFFDEGEETLSAYNDAIEVLLQKKNAGLPYLDDLQNEYTKLFIGPQKLPAPPWESVYVTRERMLFQACTLKVRKAYLAHGFIPANYPHEADDHLAIELDFMRQLAISASTAFGQHDFEAAHSLLRDQRVFLSEHLLVWIEEFAQNLAEAGKTEFYPAVAKLASRFVGIDATVLDELLGYIQEDVR